LESDRYLAETARAMIEAASRSLSVVAVLRKKCPHIYQQIRQLRACHPLLTLWGRSDNVDDNARLPIVHPAILQAIGELAGVPMRGRIVHAGLEHTYGYLFSLIETPYGYKRDRWTQSTIEDGFDIREPTLRDHPTAGTLLTNLTWFVGHIAFRDRPRELGRLRRMSRDVSSVVEQYPYSSLEVCRIVEEVTGFGVAEKCRTLQLQTDLIRFPRPPVESERDNHLLVYSALNERADSARLITVFPVTQDVVEELTARAKQGEAQVKGLPYNAYVRQLSGRTFQVRRYVLPMSAPH
jgi:hypothetical protein